MLCSLSLPVISCDNSYFEFFFLFTFFLFVCFGGRGWGRGLSFSLPFYGLVKGQCYQGTVVFTTLLLLCRNATSLTVLVCVSLLKKIHT